MNNIFLRGLVFSALVIFQSSWCHAALREEKTEYKHGETVLEGVLVYDDKTEEKRPGILVVHEWKGLGPYAVRRARQIAELGYVALAVDMYGKGVRPESHEEAAKISGLYKSDRMLTRERIKAGLQVLRSFPLTDETNIGAVGYCFGGMAVLELARSGADVKGVACFHGPLSSPAPEDAKNIKCKVLVLQGEKDPYVTKDEVKKFESEMALAGADFKVLIYPGAVHSFTVEEAGNDPSKGAAYDRQADKRSWQAMKEFFAGLFTQKGDV